MHCSTMLIQSHPARLIVFSKNELNFSQQPFCVGGANELWARHRCSIWHMLGISQSSNARCSFASELLKRRDLVGDSAVCGRPFCPFLYAA